MKKLLCISMFALSGVIMAQDNLKKVEVGDVLVLSTPVKETYKHLDFPKKNIIIKRGAIADFNSLIGKRVVVSEVSTASDGSTKVVLKREDGLDFFRFYPSVKGDLDKALSSGELKLM